MTGLTVLLIHRIQKNIKWVKVRCAQKFVFGMIKLSSFISLVCLQYNIVNALITKRIDRFFTFCMYEYYNLITIFLNVCYKIAENVGSICRMTMNKNYNFVSYFFLKRIV